MSVQQRRCHGLPQAHAAYMESALGTVLQPESARGAQHELIIREEGVELSTGAKVTLTLTRKAA